MIRISIKYTLLAAALLLATGRPAQAQLNIGGQPYSWSDDELGAVQVAYKVMPMIDRARLDEEDLQDEENNVPPRFGFPHPVQLTPAQAGTWNILPNGDRIWRLGIECPEALSINFLFDNFWLPEGATLYIYRPDRKSLIGGFTSQNNKGTQTEPGGFGTGLLYGSKVLLELYEPVDVAGQSIVSINRVVHGYRYINIPQNLGEPESGFGTSGPCQVNVNCSPEGNNWQDEKRGVAMILVAGFRWCSGSLINNTCRNTDALFLTADHCLDGKDAVNDPNATDWSFWWHYESPGCTNPGSEPGAFVTNGATVLANNSASDFALLRLTETPVNIMNPPVYMNGWDRTGSPGSGGVGIHHPAGDVKKISTHTMVPSIVGNFWELFWSATTNGHSVTEGGSSGSPLFHNGGLIIGQLFGGSSINCSNPSQDLGRYGRIAVSWSGASAQRRLSDWLDPCGLGVTSLTGGYPYACPSTLSINFPISNTRSFQSGGSIVASSTITNTANVTMKAATFVEMTPGFDATGGFLNAYIAPCTTSVIRQARPGGNEAEGAPAASAESSIRLFPNPASSELIVAYQTGGCDKTVFTITDMRGALLQFFSGNNSTGTEAEKQVRVNVSGFAPGTYLLHVQCAAFRETKKFVVMP